MTTGPGPLRNAGYVASTVASGIADPCLLTCPDAESRRVPPCPLRHLCDRVPNEVPPGRGGAALRERLSGRSVIGPRGDPGDRDISAGRRCAGAVAAGSSPVRAPCNVLKPLPWQQGWTWATWRRWLASGRLPSLPCSSPVPSVVLVGWCRYGVRCGWVAQNNHSRASPATSVDTRSGAVRVRRPAPGVVLCGLVGGSNRASVHCSEHPGCVISWWSGTVDAAQRSRRRWVDLPTRVHLWCAERELRLAGSTGLPAPTGGARQQNLDRLRAYRISRRFPRNHCRTAMFQPVFIDVEGRHCAVAHLMSCSGHGAEAHGIARTHNRARVREMDQDILANWASGSGLTPKELARIQPRYPPEVPEADWYPHAANSLPVLILVGLVLIGVNLAGLTRAYLRASAQRFRTVTAPLGVAVASAAVLIGLLVHTGQAVPNSMNATINRGYELAEGLGRVAGVVGLLCGITSGWLWIYIIRERRTRQSRMWRTIQTLNAIEETGHPIPAPAQITHSAALNRSASRIRPDRHNA